MAVSENIVQSRRVLYVGGIGDDVNQNTLRAAMIPFGPIKSVDIVSFYRQFHSSPHHCVHCVLTPRILPLSLSFSHSAHGLPKGHSQGVRFC